MSAQSIRDVIKQELPILIRSDREIQELVLELAKGRFADREQTEDRFQPILRELQRDREENKREFDRVHEEIVAITKKHEHSMGALYAEPAAYAMLGSPKGVMS